MWKCSKCGNENSEDFEICMYCGNILEKFPVQPAEPPVQPAEPPVQPEKRPVRPAKPGNGKKIALICVAGLLAVALLFFGVNFVFHSKAQSCFDEGDYLGAVENAEKDMLFSAELLIDARLELGIEYMTQDKHTEARDNFIAIKDAQIRAEALNMLAEFQMDLELYDEAYISYCAMIPDPRVEDALPHVVYMQASAAIDEAIAEGLGVYIMAEFHLEQLEMINNGQVDAAQIEELYDRMEFAKATDLLMERDYAAAVLGYEKCADFGNAAQTLEAAKYLRDGKAYEAALIAKANAGDGYDRISEDSWIWLFKNHRSNADKSMEQRMTTNAAVAVFDSSRTVIENNQYGSMANCFELGRIPSGVESAMYVDNITVVDKSIMTESGGAPDGKVLILWQVHNYVTKLTDYAIAWDVMDYLPGELYPQDLASVEYIIRISYNYQGDGWYSVEGEGTVSALKEYCKVVAEKAGSKKQLYAADTVWGEDAPSYIYSWEILDGYVTGGDPDPLGVAEAVIDAINAAIK